MIDMERGRTGGEQLLVLWTWLLEGYIPVAHIVADLDELGAFTSNELRDAPERPDAARRHAARRQGCGMTGTGLRSFEGGASPDILTT